MSTAAAARGGHVGESRVETLKRWVREAADRVAASDPALGRLRTALSASVCVGTALVLQEYLGRLEGSAGPAAFATSLFGAVVAMLGSNALSGWNRWAKARTAVFFPVFVGIGLIFAIVTSTQHLLQVVGFAVVLFLAVWVRRFGPQWFFYGFMSFMGFFFATFLHATWALVPHLLLAAAVSTVWVLLLSTTVFSISPKGTLHATNAAFFARGRAVARECADLLQAADGVVRRRALRIVSAREAAVSEAALLAEAWSAEADAVPEGWSAPALRRRLIEAQQATERMAASARSLHGADPELVRIARQVLDDLAHRDDVAALVGCELLRSRADEVEADGGEGWWPARHLAWGVGEFLRFDAAIDDPPEVDPGEDEFEAATALVNGNLPGAPAVARDVVPRGRWNPLVHASLTTRQASQVALAGVLAIVLGTILSPTRYYWAVIAAFVMFTGTASRSDTFRKGFARVAGTLVGLVAAIGLAHLTVGHKTLIIAAILVSIFFAFYLTKVSYAAMTFFITVLLGQLYTVLGTFSDSLLALRLGETAVGAVCGTAVALLFAPLSTRDTVRAARDEMLEAMVELLHEVARYAASGGEGASGAARLDAFTRTLDDRARRLALVTRPLTRPLVMGNSSPRTRRRLGLYVAAVSQCRALSLALTRRPVASPKTTVAAAKAIAQAAQALAAEAPGAVVPAAERPLHDGAVALFGDPAAARSDDPVIRHLYHLGSTLSQVAQTPNSAAGPRHRA